MSFKKTTLNIGLRVITVPTKSPTAMVLVMAETGSNYESKAENGISHFLEHLCFKGTKCRPKAADIAKELDSLGAENNAFTSNEFTGYYAKASRKHLPKIFDIVSDIYTNPTLPKKEIETERGVILEEFSMYEDRPERKVLELLAYLMYGDTPAGRSTIGSRRNIKRFSRENIVDYRKKHYTASSTVVVAVGNLHHKDILKMTRKHFKNIPLRKKSTRPDVKEGQKVPGLLIQKKRTDQTHLAMGFRAYKAKDKRIPALMLLAEVLGQGMSSRLFHKLREELGACYYVRACHEANTDYGSLVIRAGINASRIKEVSQAIVSTCFSLTKEEISQEELQKVKEHSVGNLHMSLETTDALAEFYAEQEISTGRLQTPLELEREIRNVTAEDVLAVARDIFRDSGLNLAVVGDISREKELKTILRFK